MITIIVFAVQCLAKSGKWKALKSDNVQYNKVGRWDDGMIILPSDGPTFILIDWE